MALVRPLLGTFLNYYIALGFSCFHILEVAEFQKTHVMFTGISSCLCHFIDIKKKETRFASGGRDCDTEFGDICKICLT